MRWNRFFISILLLSVSVSAMADSIYTARPEVSKYDQRIHRYRKHWAALIPTQFVLQNAGNMGVLSAGVGWEYGRRKQWETHLMFGYIPKFKSSRGKLTMTVKENFIPWSIDVKNGWSIEPLSASLYVNTVYGHEFWKSQPRRYPNGYYELMTTEFRLNVALGQQLTLQIPQNKRRYCKSVTMFYEISTCDLYIRARLLEHSIPLKDIVGLSIGVKLQTL